MPSQCVMNDRPIDCGLYMIVMAASAAPTRGSQQNLAWRVCAASKHEVCFLTQIWVFCVTCNQLRDASYPAIVPQSAPRPYKRLAI